MKACKWVYQIDEEYYETCKDDYVIENGSLLNKNDSFKFCPFCGQKIELGKVFVNGYEITVICNNSIDLELLESAVGQVETLEEELGLSTGKIEITSILQGESGTTCYLIGIEESVLKEACNILRDFSISICFKIALVK